ncbi:MAG: methylenetetrahydrofolate reductase [NAD(P)H] [Treponema sp.]|jgi:methylenetetrahydrofolate reductase (NADPH)|nr:methylenetetrahydrofolate reductase [NAD(P)H] [Treponema sp.]
MKISDILKKKKLLVSFETFPPKPSADESTYKSIVDATLELSSLNPDFMSVTYGAGGGTSSNTVDIAAKINNEGSVPALAHLTCISSTREQVAIAVQKLKESGIKNILALRGDIPQNSDFIPPNHYKYAYDLIKELKETTDFCIGAACNPEGHPESTNKDVDLDNLKKKADLGCSFLTTQMFFDNNMLYNFLYRAQLKGITQPVFAGIMPVTNAAQIKRMMALSNAFMPRELLHLIEKFGSSNEAMKQAGIDYATHQIIDLISNDVRGIHIYTMNKPDVARSIMNNISSIVSSQNDSTE